MLLLPPPPLSLTLFLFFFLSLSLSLSHTHTHTHTVSLDIFKIDFTVIDVVIFVSSVLLVAWHFLTKVRKTPL